MIKNSLIIAFLLISNLVLTQNENDIRQFDKTLNQFLNVRDFCISKNRDEVFFTVQSPNQDISQLASMKKEHNAWSEPELLSFCDSNLYLEPFLSADGNRLFFASDRPLTDSTNVKKNFDIWYVERHNNHSEWSTPKNIGTPINTDLNEFYPTLSENNNLYFTLESPNGFGKDDIYFSKWENDKYSNPVLLDENINSDGYEFNAFISKKEDFLLFSKYNEADGQGSGDLYISKKDAKGKWKKATNLGIPINTNKMEYCPFYDENNQILYFTSKRSNINSRNFKNMSDFKKHIRENNNGLSKIYMVALKIK
ncbi:hypothetical protein [Winogradskyella psychrotolerans]|uniref:hypothetical protein n=1 Tax=Winogradskyella psychrotolerans TaxID=1344585 RepID=UPI001C06832A|nr:hypothetical protein [Winogradskyella psychrotolerans]MBU2929632.1 hypothetical protein [Winogradskyella psychrotolerans]